MKILKLQAENVKRLSAVTIEPDGAIVTIKGRNGQGKSSCLDAIMFALAGKDSHPPEVIRRGADKAAVVLDLGELVVERRWTANDRSSITVKGRDGAKLGSPQAVLDKLVGALSFDPLAFLREPAKHQVETVRKLVGLDFTAHDLKRDQLYNERTLVNREVTALRAAVETAPVIDAPAEPVNLADLLAEQQRLLEQKAENDRKRQAYREAGQRWEVADREARAAKKRVAELEEQLKDARGRAAAADETLQDAVDAGKAARAACDAIVEPDLGAIQARLSDVQRINAAVSAAQLVREKAEQLKAKSAEAQKFTEQIEALDAEKAKKLAEAPFPVKGLGFTADGLTFNGLPLEQASSAERLRVSVAMAAASNPKLRVILVRDGSLLDADSLSVLGRLAEEHDLQVWLEMVSDDGSGCGIVIEDGQVVETERGAA